MLLESKIFQSLNNTFFRLKFPHLFTHSNVTGQVSKIKVKYEKFLDLVKVCDTSTNIEFKELRKDLLKNVRTVDKQIKDLKGAVDMVDKNREKFPHIKDVELNSRKKFVDDTQRSINGFFIFYT